MTENSSSNKSLKIPGDSPRVTMNDPDFDKLTSAEKLNDSKYRSLIYKKYPNEPICGCQLSPKSKLSKIVNNSSFKCPGGCFNNCCKAKSHAVVEIKDGNNKKLVNFSGNCIVNIKNFNGDIYNGTLCPDRRMRGGGCCGGVGNEENQMNRYKKNPDRRECSRNPENAMRPLLQEKKQDKKSLISDYYSASRKNNTDEYLPNTVADCYYPVKKYRNSDGIAGQNFKKLEKELDIDFMIEKLRKTQEFVDSLGNEFGMAGLGLMDPSDSPYFKANIERKKSQKIPTIPPAFVQQQPEKKFYCRAPADYRYSQDKSGPFSITNDFSLRYPRLSRDNRENSDSENDGGPCGESACKSRQKKNDPDEGEQGEIIAKSSGKKTVKRGGKKSKKSKKFKRGGVNSGASIFSSLIKTRYVYTTGDDYLNTGAIHEKCLSLRKRIPGHMGWLWNNQEILGDLKPRPGWRPGAISRQMREIINVTKALMKKKSQKPRATISRDRSLKLASSKSLGSVKKSQVKNKVEVEEEEKEPPATLNIVRKDRTYYVTMYPIKQEKMDLPKLEEPMKPLQFKFTKNKNDDSDESSSSASDLEIEFSPPAAVNRYRKKPNVVHVDTQVKQEEIINAFKVNNGNEVREKKGKKKNKQ